MLKFLQRVMTHSNMFIYLYVYIYIYICMYQLIGFNRCINNYSVKVLLLLEPPHSMFNSQLISAMGWGREEEEEEEGRL